MPHLTDAMLTYIEENETTRMALGYSKGDGEGKNNGLKQAEHHKRIAIAVLVPAEDGIWKEINIKALTGAIKNRLARYV
jgi:hypothetical protein